MIGGINNANPFAFQTGNNAPARERGDVARAPAASPEKPQAGVRRDLADAVQIDPASDRARAEELERRIEARRAAEDARLERFRADDVPLPTARALSTFAGVAAAGQDAAGSGSIAGIDIVI